MAELPNDQTDKLFQEGAELHDFTYNPSAWSSMEEMLDAEKKRRRIWPLFFYGLLGLGLVSMLYFALAGYGENPEVASDTEGLFTAATVVEDLAPTGDGTSSNKPTALDLKTAAMSVADSSLLGAGDAVTEKAPAQETLAKEVGKKDNSTTVAQIGEQNNAAGTAASLQQRQAEQMKVSKSQEASSLQSTIRPNQNQSRKTNSTNGEHMTSRLPLISNISEKNSGLEVDNASVQGGVDGVAESNTGDPKNSSVTSPSGSQLVEEIGGQETIKTTTTTTTTTTGADETDVILVALPLSGIQLVASDSVSVDEELVVPSPPPPPSLSNYPTPFLSRVSVRVQGGMLYSVTDNIGEGSLRTRYGVGFGYALNDKLSVGSGVSINNLLYVTSGDRYKTKSAAWFGGASPSRIEAQCRVLEIPVEATYHLNGSRAAGVFMRGGVLNYILLKEDYSYNYDDSFIPPTVEVADLRPGWKGVNSNQHYLGMAQVALGYQIPISKRSQLQVEGFVHVPLTGIGHGEIKVWSFGLNTAVNLNLK